MNIAIQNIWRLSVKVWSLFSTKHCLHQVPGGFTESASNHKLNPFVVSNLIFSGVAGVQARACCPGLLRRMSGRLSKALLTSSISTKPIISPHKEINLIWCSMFLTNLSWLNLISLFSSVCLQIVVLFSWEMKLSWQWFIIQLSFPLTHPPSLCIFFLSPATLEPLCAAAVTLQGLLLKFLSMLSCPFHFGLVWGLYYSGAVTLPPHPRLPQGMESCCYPSHVMTFDQFTLSQTASGSLPNFRMQNTIAF